MEKSECGTSTSAAMDDLEKSKDSLVEEFKTEAENMLAQMTEDLKEFAARDAAKPAQRQKSPELALPSVLPEPHLEENRSDSTSRNLILPLDYEAGSAMNNDLEINVEAEQEKNELTSLNNEGENEEVEVAGLEDSSTLDGPRKLRRTVKEPAWMKDFMTAKDAGLEDFLKSDRARKSRRTVKEPACMGDSMTVEDAELEDHSTADGSRKSRRTVKEPAWMKDFESGKAS